MNVMYQNAEGEVMLYSLHPSTIDQYEAEVVGTHPAAPRRSPSRSGLLLAISLPSLPRHRQALGAVQQAAR